MDTPTPPSRKKRSGGFSLVESMVAVVLISAVGIIVVQLLHKNTLSLIWNQQTRKASALADMVLEKYDYLASVNFSTLEQHDQTKTTASSFFVTGTNTQGYEGMSITTVADAPSADGSRKLTVTISWGTGGPGQSFKISKFLAASTSQPGGAPVFVFVTNSGGAGIAGFEVRAEHHYNPAYTNAIGTNEVIAFTDADGYAVLNNVSVADSFQPMPIMARKPGSDSTVKKSDPNYVAGYYAPPNHTWATKSLTVRQTSANTVRFEMANNDIQPLGSISGTLANTSGGPAGNMEIGFTGSATRQPEQEIELGESWDLHTENDGHYEFNNLAPGSIALFVRGREGSHPTIPPGDAGFEQGYSGHGGNGGNPWRYNTSMTTPASDLPPYNVQIRALGWLNLTTQAVGGGGLLPGATVYFTWPDIGFGSREDWTGSADGTANLKLYNLFAKTNQNVRFHATVNPQGCANNGNYLFNKNASCTVGQQNDVTLNLNVGATISGTLTDTAGTPVAGMQVSVPGMASGLLGPPVTAVTDGAGAFILCGIAPSSLSIPDWPSVPFSYSDPNRWVSATFSGFVVDANKTTMRLPGYPMQAESRNDMVGYLHTGTCASDPNPTDTDGHTITSDANGAFGPMCAYARVQGTQNKTVTGTAPTFTAGTVSISTSTAAIGFWDHESPYFHSPEQPFTMTHGAVNNSYTHLSHIAYHRITGTLRDENTNTPLADITFDPCAGCPWWIDSCEVTTDNNGFFEQSGCVYGTGASSPGHVTVSIPSGVTASNTGFAYSGDSADVEISNPPMPGTPITVNMSLSRTGGGM